MIYLTAKEREKIVVDWNKTEVPNIYSKMFCQLFEEQVIKTPDNIAVIFDKQKLTYKELNEKANKLAYYIRSEYKRINNEEQPKELLIGVCIERSIDTLISILGILKIGGVYVPLDPDYPVGHLTQILLPANIKYVFVNKKNADVLADVCKDTNIKLWSIEDVPQECNNIDDFRQDISLDMLAYVIHTSGSTGVPKGAMVEHQGMLNHLFAKIKSLSISHDDIVIQNASQCFDISIWQFLAVLLTGGSVSIVRDNITTPIKLIKAIKDSRATILEVVPSLLQLMLDFIKSNYKIKKDLLTLRWIILTGELLSSKLCEQWFEIFGNKIPMVNAYGPTECSDDVTHHFIYHFPESGALSIPIGKPIQNTKVYVANENMELLPVNVRGELYISGDCVGRGYLNEAELTKNFFLPNPFATNEDIRNKRNLKLYKTGDIVKWLHDGNLEFIGRADNQIKIKGARVELEEIESVLQEYKYIVQCIVTVHKKNKNQLVAYYVGENDLVGEKDVKLYIKDRLPHYMIPTYFIKLKQMPLLKNGKIDRKELSNFSSSF